MPKIRVWVEANGRGGWYDEDTVNAPTGWAEMTEVERTAFCDEIYAAHLAQNVDGGYEVIEDPRKE